MNELRYYLESLLDHSCAAPASDCAECRRLDRVYQFLRTELFTTVIYRETGLPPRAKTEIRRQAANRAAAGPRRPSSV